MLGKCQRATRGAAMYYLLPSCELSRVLPVVVHETKYKKSEEGKLVGNATRLTVRHTKAFIRVRQFPFHDPIFASELMGRSAKSTILGDEVDGPFQV